MEDLRNYLGNSKNGDIFEIINKAIRVAASDYPLEFQNNKHKIAETLSSSIKPQLPTTSTNKPQRTNVIRIKLKKKAAQDGDTKRIAEILRIKRILDNNSQGEPELVCELLSMVGRMELGLDVLKATGIGKTVNVLRKHASKDVNRMAMTVMKQWKDMVYQRFPNKSGGVKPTSEKPRSSNNINGRVTPDQRKSKVMDSKKNQIKGENSTVEEKFEAAKRKLQHNYEAAENMKKKRRVHVIEFHELSRHGLLPQQQRQLKSSNEQLKRRGNVNSRIHRLVSKY